MCTPHSSPKVTQPNSAKMQPRILPRPDLALLGIKYRRIPVLSIGRDVYLDTRLILQKLEQLAPEKPRLAADSNPEHCAIERLLEVLTIDGGLFKSVVQLMPPGIPQLRDLAFLQDRADLLDGVMLYTPEALAEARPDAISEVRNAFELLETTLLADGRAWILKTEAPSLADIEAVWPLHWISLIPGALPPDQISKALYPRVFSWIERFQQAVSSTENGVPVLVTVSGQQAMEMIVSSMYNDMDGHIDETDPAVQHLGLQKGQLVRVWPTDSGSNHKDVGTLVSINGKEVAIETIAGDTVVRVHAPRHGFRVCAHKGMEQ
jgi:glutathione S-transferase